jgi:hypothetical protein
VAMINLGTWSSRDQRVAPGLNWLTVSHFLRSSFSLDEAADDDDHVGMIQRPLGERLGLVGYGVLAGIAASVIGAWVSSALGGGARIGVWIGLTVVLAVAAARFADQVVVLAGRLLRSWPGRRPAAR